MLGLAFLLVSAAVGLGLHFLDRADGETAAVSMPALSEGARIGQIVFGKHCSECHGANAGGTSRGPPLIHRYYEPSHHDDRSFRAAIARGVRQHHWRFGDMPAQRQFARDEVAPVVTFIREVQRANGIF